MLGLLAGCAPAAAATDADAARLAIGVAATLTALPTALPTAPLAAPLTPTGLSPAPLPPSLLPPPLPTATPTLPSAAAVTVSPTAAATLPPPSLTPSSSDADAAVCAAGFQVRLFAAPRVTRDLFEHHAVGVFLALPLELTNLGATAVQVWDGDYHVLETLPGETRQLAPRHDATGYLYNQHGLNWYQEWLEPGQTITTWVVFDAARQAQAWTLILQPGAEGGAALCELRLPLPPPPSQ